MAHNNYYLDLCVETFVVNDDAVLLRLHEKYNYWGTPGGHIDPGEDVNEAALRSCAVTYFITSSSLNQIFISRSASSGDSDW